MGKRQVWDCQGASRLDELERLLRPQLLHRRKLDCLDLPPKLRCFHPVPLAAAAERQFQRQLAAGPYTNLTLPTKREV